MSTFIDRCPACGKTDCISSIVYSEFPAFLFPMAKDWAKNIECADLDLHLCFDCGHLFQAKPDKMLLSRIYGEYYANYPYDNDEAMNRSYRQPFYYFFDLLVSTYITSSMPKLLEIGCSRPANMIPFAEKGWECIGIDPSPLASGTSESPNIKVTTGYYENIPIEEPVDIIVSRFNLEHIADLDTHLLKMQRDLRGGGRVVVQVPNVAYYLENTQPLFVAHEHIHYFSQHSLTTLFERMGFTTIACYSASEPSILACFEKRSGFSIIDKSVNTLMENYKANIISKAMELIQCLKGKNRVLLYGCGLALYWVLSVLRDHHTLHVTVVDDNPALEGKALPHYGLPISQPNLNLISDTELIILTLNPIYHDRVITHLLSYGCPIELLKIGVKRLESEHLP